LSELSTMYPAQPNSPYTTTLGEISASDTAVVVADASVLPTTLPFLMTLGYDKSASETVLVTAKTDNTLTIVRAVDGNALLWVAGTKCARIFTAKDLNDVQSNLLTLNADKQEKLVSFTVTLPVSWWDTYYFEIYVEDERFLTGNYDYIISPVPSSLEKYSAAGVYADTVSTNGEICFYCDVIPTSNLSVCVLRIDKN